MIDEVLQQHIVAEPAIAALLATYDFGGASVSPAVFTTEGGIPEDAEYPAAYIQEISADDFSVRDSAGATVGIDIAVYDDKHMGSRVLELALLIWQRVNRADLAAALALRGYSFTYCMADWPIKTSDAGQFPGYTIRARVALLKT